MLPEDLTESRKEITTLRRQLGGFNRKLRASQEKATNYSQENVKLKEMIFKLTRENNELRSIRSETT